MASCESIVKRAIAEALANADYQSSLFTTSSNQETLLQPTKQSWWSISTVNDWSDPWCALVAIQIKNSYWIEEFRVAIFIEQHWLTKKIILHTETASYKSSKSETRISVNFDVSDADETFDQLNPNEEVATIDSTYSCFQDSTSLRGFQVSHVKLIR